jgi:hypothetical protein
MVVTNCKESFYSSAGKEGVIRLWVWGGGVRKSIRRKKTTFLFIYPAAVKQTANTRQSESSHIATANKDTRTIYNPST